LVDGNFSGYEALSKALKEKGYTISKSSIHRYGQDFEKRLAALKVATEQAKAIAEAAPDDAGMVGDALTRLVQQKAFDVLLDMEELDPTSIKLTDLGKMIADLNRSSVAQKKWMVEAKQKAKAAAEEVTKVIKAGGLSPEAVEDIRAKILGIAS
jgi:uncharacterized protein YejL (UPF0352 family)